MPKGKIVFKTGQEKKNGQNKKQEKKKKNGTKKQKASSPGVEPGLSARASNSLTTAPQ